MSTGEVSDGGVPIMDENIVAAVAPVVGVATG